MTTNNLILNSISDVIEKTEAIKFLEENKKWLYVTTIEPNIGDIWTKVNFWSFRNRHFSSKEIFIKFNYLHFHEEDKNYSTFFFSSSAGSYHMGINIIEKQLDERKNKIQKVLK